MANRKSPVLAHSPAITPISYLSRGFIFHTVRQSVDNYTDISYFYLIGCRSRSDIVTEHFTEMSCRRASLRKRFNRKVQSKNNTINIEIHELNLF